jgi:dihydrodipicolinate synthase/N-acetylneuraminate lyase
MATPPFFAKSDYDGLRAHFAEIAGAGLPLYIFNSPGRTGVDLAPAVIAGLAHETGAGGVKQAAPDIADLADLLATDLPVGFHVIGGAESSFWPALVTGAAGNTATAASAIPEVFAAIRDAAKDGDLVRGRELYQSLAPLRTLYRSGGGQAPVVKALMDARGLAGGPPRPPLRELGRDQLDAIRGVLALATGSAN